MKKKEIRRRQRLELWDMAKDAAEELDDLKTALREVLPVKLPAGQVIIPTDNQRDRIARTADKDSEPTGKDIHYLDGRALKVYPDYRAELEEWEGEQYIIFFKWEQS